MLWAFEMQKPPAKFPVHRNRRGEKVQLLKGVKPPEKATLAEGLVTCLSTTLQEHFGPSYSDF